MSELATFLDAAFEGDGGAEVAGFASLLQAKADELVFVRDAGLAAGLGASSARVVLAPDGVETGGRPTIRSAQPAADFSRLVEAFAPRWRPAEGVAEGAHVDRTAEVAPTASVEPGARVGPGCRVGARTVVSAGAILVADVRVGEDGWIHAGALLREGTRVGDRVILQPGVVLGGDGFGYVPDAQGRPVAMAQRGIVVLEDDVEIGANTTVDRATLDETRIRRGAKIDNQVQIAHNCDIGEDVLIAAQSGLSGNTVVGNRAILMARCATTGHLTIGEGAFLAANTAVHHDVEPGARLYGAPAMEERGWHRTIAAQKRLPELLKRVRRLERQLESDDD
ncbi:MAG: UDP-3-O-(3-hydroxymyristoyl)glucosamine N-acyltransferase [Myxococcota bacterium]